MSFSFSAIIATSGPQGLAGDKSQDFGKKSAYVSAEFQNAIACQKTNDDEFHDQAKKDLEKPTLPRMSKSLTLSHVSFSYATSGDKLNLNDITAVIKQVISVTHRLSTTRNADTIIVLDDGKIVETGTYKHLMNRPGSAFAEMVHKTGDTPVDHRDTSRNSSFVGFVVEDLGNVLDTHEALHEFQRKLSNRSGENGAILSAWQVRKLSSDRRHLSRGASQSGSGLANLSAARDSHDERDSYLVL
ncbi:hypothetical protein DYB28_002052 [Aphanomyces astaci]|uniref:Uncharacterized protein n=1 Tax=Aphanomyces astaci TaxID=112090 RepID=A0A9X8DUR5_APHAT|nr:hypothetical protein DYB28_002052 [Aphanomyces astaci]